MQYVPNFGYIVSALNSLALNGIGVTGPDQLSASDKLSPLFDSSDPAPSGLEYAVVEFYPDVDMGDARSIVVQAQLLLLDNADLLDHHLLVSGTADQVASLTDWDEVAYVFPASDDLVSGVHVNSCSGALTVQGPVGQSIAKVGSWGGGTSADLLYAFSKVTDQIPADTIKSEIARAFAEWARYAKVSFTPTLSLASSNTLAIEFFEGEHGDGYPFTSTALLAHTFYPYPVNPEPIAGDMHFNFDVSWKVGADIDLFSVALHETGHALGLGHSDQPGAVMYPYYKQVTGLSQEDIGAILTLYAPQDNGKPAVPAVPLTLLVNDPGPTTTSTALNLTGTTAGGTGNVTITWLTNRGSGGRVPSQGTWAITAIPLALGPNVITITAVDASQTTASHTVSITVQQQPVTPPPTPSAPVLRITGPVGGGGTYTANSPSVTVSGTASDASGVAKVAWTTSQGRSGQASGTSAWSAGPITVDPGTVAVTVTATAQSGSSTAQSIQVVYSVQQPPATPTAPPGPLSLAITTPSSTNVNTSSSSIVCSGTASGSGITVLWSTSNGDSGTASGTANWSIPAIPVYVGTNNITVKVKDSSGNTAWRSFVVTRH